MKKILLFILFLGILYASPAQKNPRKYLLDEQYEQPELLKHEYRELNKQQLAQERLKELQSLKAQNENLLKNTKGLKNSLTVAMNADDRAVLETLYNATDGDNWRNNTNWLTSDGSDWYGITLDTSGRVTEIDLFYNNLNGTIPNELGKLTNLQMLYLGYNQISGSIPAELGNLTNLQWLYLNKNQLSSSIPAELGNLTNLQTLYLEWNQLSGSIPAELGNLTNLQGLYLNDNQLSGSIPAELGNLINLQVLYLNQNQLSGSIPAELGNLINLQVLYLNDNQFTSLPNLSTLVNIESCCIENNWLDFGDIETSSISWHFYAPQADVAISKNENGDSITFKVSVAGTNNVYKWYKNDIEISDKTTDSLTVANTEDGVYYCEITNPDFPDLVLTSVVEEVGNLLTNGIITSEYDVLIALYNATNGNKWTLNTNWKTTEPVNSWHGVSTSKAHITKINLFNNQLNGSIPSELGKLTNLQELNLYNNQLSGSIPPELGNLTKLQYLYLGYNQLSGNIPPELGNLTKIQNLFLLYNQLSGSIPAKLGNLTMLQSLYLENNQLSGSIPKELGNLTNLHFLYLSNNQLSGSIPAEIGNLTNLQILILTNNKLSESIPAKLGNLTNLRWLYLDENQLSGSIPMELENLTNLLYLELSNNQFTSLPDLSALVNLDYMYTSVNNNSLDFGDLETSSINWYSYAPQANVSIYKYENGGNITFNVTVAGTNNVYKWYKNDVEISGETSDSLTITNTEDGVYCCEISNPDFPDLVLTSVVEEVGNLLTNGIITSEYNALIALYNATNGDNWTQNTNWKTTEPVNSWHGVSVSKAHITEINLFNNQLSGSIPSELANLTNLKKLNLSSNQLTSLPDLTTLVNLDSLGTVVDNNSLDFGDLETSGISWYSYYPQAKVGTEQNIELSVGESKTLSVSVGGSNNSYQWYINGTAIDGATDSEYTISSFTETTDAGVYVCKITNSYFPYLILESNNITVSKKATSAIDVKDDSQLSIYPNPVSDRLTIHFSKERAQMLKILDLTGKQLFSRKVNSIDESVKLSGLETGVYILQLKFKNQTISKKIIKN